MLVIVVVLLYLLLVLGKRAALHRLYPKYIAAEGHKRSSRRKSSTQNHDEKPETRGKCTG